MADINLTSVVGGGIKSVQRGVVTIASTSENETVSSVDMDKSFLSISFSTNASSITSSFAQAELTTGTNISFTRVSGANVVYVSWELVEFY